VKTSSPNVETSFIRDAEVCTYSGEVSKVVKE